MRRILVTGASSDIGLAVCKLHLSRGNVVIGHYRTGQKAFFDLVESAPGMSALKIDFADPENLERAIADDPDAFLNNDVIVNAAAFYEPTPFHELTADTVLRALTVNMMPGIQLMRTIAPAMAERGWGRIVHLSSVGVKFGGGGSSFAYALSNHAIEFLPADHKAWAASNVLVNTLRLGVTDTRLHRLDPNKDMTERVSLIPAQRMATPKEMAQTIYWFSSDDNTYITGQTVTVAGGE
ncbi:MAG: SDR family oxidoreductase [Rhodospirillales bacterium]|nr:SDR family oxidoreductase [Rhodospirillales bacterium]